MARPIVDPRFPATLRRLRGERGLTVRSLAAQVHQGKTLVHDLETGRATPLPDVARRLDDALVADGELAGMVREVDRVLTPDESARLAHVRHRPRRVDAATVQSLTGVLAHQRRLEDSVGAGPLLLMVTAQAKMVEGMADEARGAVRPAVVNIAGQWSQFAGWLNATSGRVEDAQRWYARALEHATEVDDESLTATALSMRGHLAWLNRQPGPVIGLSEAALRRRGASPGVRALAAQQQARGLALAGDSTHVDRLLEQARELAAEAVERPDREPPWAYFFSPHYFAMQRGLVCRLLGRGDEAIEHLTQGLATTPAELRGSEFVHQYVLQLAVAHRDAGDRHEALRLLEQVRTAAAEMGSQRLLEQVDELERRWQ